jgi:hypothetical protein
VTLITFTNDRPAERSALYRYADTTRFIMQPMTDLIDRYVADYRDVVKDHDVTSADFPRARAEYLMTWLQRAVQSADNFVMGSVR